MPKYKHDKMQKFQNTNMTKFNRTKYKCKKIQMQKNTNTRKYKWNKIQIEQNAKIPKYTNATKYKLT